VELLPLRGKSGVEWRVSSGEWTDQLVLMVCMGVCMVLSIRFCGFRAGGVDVWAQLRREVSGFDRRS
jgi:hypothetical protein